MPVSAADQRLHSLRNAGTHGNHNKGQIRDHPICRHPPTFPRIFRIIILNTSITAPEATSRYQEGNAQETTDPITDGCNLDGAR